VRSPILQRNELISEKSTFAGDAATNKNNTPVYRTDLPSVKFKKGGTAPKEEKHILHNSSQIISCSAK
jgi:hypothetical protein